MSAIPASPPRLEAGDYSNIENISHSLKKCCSSEMSSIALAVAAVVFLILAALTAALFGAVLPLTALLISSAFTLAGVGCASLLASRTIGGSINYSHQSLFPSYGYTTISIPTPTSSNRPPNSGNSFASAPPSTGHQSGWGNNAPVVRPPSSNRPLNSGSNFASALSSRGHQSGWGNNAPVVRPSTEDRPAARFQNQGGWGGGSVPRRT